MYEHTTALSFERPQKPPKQAQLVPLTLHVVYRLPSQHATGTAVTHKQFRALPAVLTVKPSNGPLLPIKSPNLDTAVASEAQGSLADICWFYWYIPADIITMAVFL